ncbi:transcriptional regulator, LuxR family domain protein [Escherichia coli BCE034_MS-14]|nr:transcriptional regulator, LuxR family domain protein [Escherichia coli BCE034_MS-14]
MDSLPNSYKNHVAGIGSGVGFSEIIRLIGLEAMVRMQRQLLRQFIKTSDEQTQRDLCFAATIESLIELTLKWSTKTGHRVRVFSSIDFPIRLVVTHHYIRAVLVRCNIQRYSPLLRELHR